MEFKAGMKIRMKEYCSDCEQGKVYTLFYEEGSLRARTHPSIASHGCCCKEKWEIVNEEELEVLKMNIKLNEIKKSNLAEASKQLKQEKTNAEIEFAKAKYKEAQDKVDELDRQIKTAEEAKKPWLEILSNFN